MTDKPTFEALLDRFIDEVVFLTSIDKLNKYRAELLAAYTDLEERERMRLAGISTAAIGYWKEGDSIHPDYDTVALRDVAKLYAKYDELYQARAAAGREGQFPHVSEVGCIIANGACIRTSCPNHGAAVGRERQPVARVAEQGNEDGYSDTIDKQLPVGTPLFTHPAPKVDADWVCVPRAVALSAAAEIEQMMDQEGCAPALRPMRAVLRNKLREAAADWLCVPRELMERVDFVLACAGLASIQDGERTFNDVHAMLAAVSREAAK